MNKKLEHISQDIIEKAKEDYLVNNYLQTDIIEKYGLSIYQINQLIGRKPRIQLRGPRKPKSYNKEDCKRDKAILLKECKKAFPKMTKVKLDKLIFNYGISIIEKSIQKKLAG